MSATTIAPPRARSARPARRRRGHHHVLLSRCIGCGACEPACPGRTDAIQRIADDYMGRFCIDPARCIDCGFCVGMCPADAIVRLAEGERPSTSQSRAEALKEWMARRQAATPEG
jgi:formate hydrogenlyase subunit 6/NADH:ubiquinone oxidoreductase subunit I